MNMQSIMAQAKKMQNELQKTQKEIENTEFEGKNGVVNVIITGNYNVKKINISDNTIEKELLEDMLMLALNDSFAKIQKLKEEKLGKYTGGLGGLF